MRARAKSGWPRPRGPVSGPAKSGEGRPGPAHGQSKNDALEPDEVPIEGETDILTNTDHHHPSNNSQNIPRNPQLEPVEITLNEPKSVENKPKVPEIIQQPPSQLKQTRRNSLEGLPQFSNEQFGWGKRQRVPASRTSATIADVDDVLDVEEAADVTLSRKGKGLPDQGGEDVDEDEDMLFGEDMEDAMVISEDEPSLREDLNGDERVAWSDAIDAELTQKSMLGSP